ncbi:MAG: hypothetical protein Kow0059_16850 [Candidatus Sumerlaeia bacterium]
MNSSSASPSGLQVKYLEIFKHLSRIVSGAGDLQMALRTTVDLIRSILGAERCSILLLDEGAGVLRMGAASGIPEAEWKSVTVAVGEGVAGRVILEKKPVLAGSAAAFKGAGTAPDGTYQSTSFISVPMIHQDRALGVINVTDKSDGGEMTASDLELVGAVAGFLALIVYNRSLLDDFSALSLRLHNTLNSLPTALMTVTANHVVIEVNKKALALVGRTAESFSPLPLGAMLTDAQAALIAGLVDRAIGQHTGVTRDVEWRPPAGKDSFPLRLTVTPFYAPESDETIAIVQMEDLTLLRELDSLRQIEQIHNNFLSLVSHELRTPLTSIKGATHLLQGSFSQQSDPTLLGLLGIISSNTERLIKMVNQLIDVAQLQQGVFVVQRQLSRLEPILTQAVSNFEQAAAAKHIQVLTEIEDNLPEVNMDRDKMLAAVGHLLDNAIKFTPIGGVVRLLAEADQGAVKVHVIDNGIGVDRRYWDKVFGKFYQIEDPMTRKVGGAGLGLFLTRAIVLMHQGKIELLEPDDKGTHVCITLPAGQ